MNFEKILNQWEKRKKRSISDDLEQWLDRNPPQSEAKRDEKSLHPNMAAAERRRRLRAQKPQRQLDLHGLTASEAEEKVERFLRDSRRDGLNKVLIIHGRGKHSKSQPVLPRAVRKAIQASAHAGEYGAADKDYGGRGAIWVILRPNSPPM